MLQLRQGNYAPAVHTALECLRTFGVDLPDSPTPEQMRAEYEEMCRTLGDRPIQSLVDLPMMDIGCDQAYLLAKQIERMHLGVGLIVAGSLLRTRQTAAIVSGAGIHSMLPWRGRMRPEMVRRSVVLPAPFEPMRVTISPSLMCRETSCKAVITP